MGNRDYEAAIIAWIGRCDTASTKAPGGRRRGARSSRRQWGKRPHEEHDYGSFDRCDRAVWFKIDYFDLTLEQASSDPADPAVTKRIMTIGLAQDW